MHQETGETRDAIIEDDNKQIAEIIETNKGLRDPYWIVVFAKPSKNCVDGKPALIKHIKPYKTEPSSQVGMIIGKVDNSLGTIDWEVNMPQRPFNFDGLPGAGNRPRDEFVVETSTIPHAYITK
jgi:hypothetical protein